jgi:2-methylcitrate dehydratase PrpD
MIDDLSLTERVAAHLYRSIDDNTRSQARLHLLDWIACVVGARGSEVARRFDGVEEDWGAKAAFLATVLGRDDVYRAASLRPGAVIWATVVPGQPTDMEHMIDAAVKGYDAMIAIGTTLDDHHHTHYHATITAGLFGAAAAASSLLDCDFPETAMALGLVGAVAGGITQRNDASMAHHWQIAHAMVTGGSAAYFARLGATAPRHILEGQQGVYAATCRAPHALTLTDEWRIHDVHIDPCFNSDGAAMTRPATAELLCTKTHDLFKHAGLNWAEANRAITLSLEGDDADPLIEALKAWLS